MNDEEQAINGQRSTFGNDSIEIVIHQGAFTSHPAIFTIHNPPIVRVSVEIARHALALEGPAGNPPLAIQLWSDGDGDGVTYEIAPSGASRAINGDGHAINGQRSTFVNESIEFGIHQGAFTRQPATIPFLHPPIVRAPLEITRHALGLKGPAGNAVSAPLRNISLDHSGCVLLGMDLSGVGAGVLGLVLPEMGLTFPASTTGETFWLTRDNDGASSPRIKMDFGMGNLNSGWVVVDWSNVPLPPNAPLSTLSFQIGAERAEDEFAVVDGAGNAHHLYPDWNHSWNASYLVSWDNSGAETRYVFNYLLAEVDESQEWSLVDVTTGENFGPAHQVLTGFAPWHPDPQPGWMYLSLIESRKNDSLRLYANGAGMAVSAVVIDPQYQAEGAHLSYWAVTASPDGTQHQTVEVRYVPAMAPVPTWNGGFTVYDDTAGDWKDAPGAPLDFSQWYLPATETLGLRVTVTRWDNPLLILYPNGESAPVERGMLEGSWGVTPDGNGYFTSYGWFDATATVHPDAPWVLWDTKRNEFVSPDEGTTTDFINDTDDTDTDGDTLPDWYEYLIGSDPNHPRRVQLWQRAASHPACERCRGWG